MPTFRALLGALLLLALVGASAAPTANAASDPRQRVLELTNAERAKAGLPPLVWSGELAAAAEGYARLLAETNCFGHTCGGTDLRARAEASGYQDWTFLGENLAGGQPTPEEAVAAWMNSPGHRANLLNPHFTELGVGLAQGGFYRIYWSQEFGTRPAGVTAYAAEADSEGEQASAMVALESPAAGPLEAAGEEPAAAAEDGASDPSGAGPTEPAADDAGAAL